VSESESLGSKGKADNTGARPSSSKDRGDPSSNCHLFNDGTVGELKFVGGGDYENALDWIRRAKSASIERYEQE